MYIKCMKDSSDHLVIKRTASRRCYGSSFLLCHRDLQAKFPKHAQFDSRHIKTKTSLEFGFETRGSTSAADSEELIQPPSPGDATGNSFSSSRTRKTELNWDAYTGSGADPRGGQLPPLLPLILIFLKTNH